MATQKHINVLVGSLQTPTDMYLIECLPLESCTRVKNDVILFTVNDILRQLGIRQENFALLLTDATRFISLAGKTLKELYSFDACHLHYTLTT